MSFAGRLITLMAKVEPAELVPPVVPMRNVDVAEEPPLVDGFRTAILAVPGVATWEAVTLAVSCVLDTNVVGKTLPFSCADA